MTGLDLFVSFQHPQRQDPERGLTDIVAVVLGSTGVGVGWTVEVSLVAGADAEAVAVAEVAGLFGVSLIGFEEMQPMDGTKVRERVLRWGSLGR